jgi:predicted N-formylglutamate amidohydrolase
MLLNELDGNPVRTNGIAMSSGRFLLIGDHAGNAVPEVLGGLGLGPAELNRHIALDLGVRELGLELGKRLTAPFLWQHFSRLVCDCNRDFADADWASTVSDGTNIPGNAGLEPAELTLRREEVYEPYHQAVGRALDARRRGGQETILVSLHSFTPAMGARERPWEIGVLHDGREDHFALALLEKLRGVDGLVVGDNEPYDMDDTDYTVPRHAYPRGLPYVELEIRQDLLGDAVKVHKMVECLTPLLSECSASIRSGAD